MENMYDVGQSYYVDQSAGNDSNNGTSPSAPWKNAPGMTAYTGSMKNVIKISAVNSTCNDLPEEADPYNRKFDIDFVKIFVDSNLEKNVRFFV